MVGESTKTNSKTVSTKPNGLSRADHIALRVSVAQTVLAVVGFIVGLIALYAALNEADAVRKQQQASVWPFIDIAVSKNNVPGERFYSVAIANKGIGPAKIQSIEAYLDGEPKRSWWDLIDAAAALEKQPLLLSNANAIGTVLAAGEVATLMRADATSLKSEEGIGYNELLNRLGAATDAGRMHMKICYCSVFDDCWVRNTTQPGDAASVDACAPSPDGVVF